MAGLLLVPSYMPALTPDGDPVPGARLYVFSNQTSTKATAYADAGLTTPLPNPVIADAGGAFPLIWAAVGSVFSASVTDALGAPLAGGAFDNVSVSADASTAAAVAAVSAAVSASTSSAAAAAAAAATSASVANVLSQVAALVAGGIATSASNVGFLPPGTGGVLSTVQAKLQQSVCVEDFRSVLDLDDTNAIQRALNTGAPEVVMTKAAYTISGTITRLLSKQILRGRGKDGCIITSSAAGHSFVVLTGIIYVGFEGFTLTRAPGTAISGRDGIHFTGATEGSFVRRVHIQRHYMGLRLGTTNQGWLEECSVENNSMHGLYGTDADGAGPLQWQVRYCYSGQNNGCGVYYEATLGSVSVGDFTGLQTFANKLNGFKGVDSGAGRLQAVRFLGGFLGQDGDDEIYLDARGYSAHSFDNVYTELAGTSSCGVDLTTAPTGRGRGFNISSNVQIVVMSGVKAIGHSYSGIRSTAVSTTIVGPKADLNGAASVSGELAGIFVSGAANINGGSVSLNPYGVFAGNDNHIIQGMDLRGNTTAAIGSSVTLSLSKIANNFTV